jgi:hypothetical protein
MPILNGVEAAKLIKGEFKQFNGFKFIQNYWKRNRHMQTIVWRIHQ